jgi:hypothetical protein
VRACRQHRLACSRCCGVVVLVIGLVSSNLGGRSTRHLATDVGDCTSLSERPWIVIAISGRVVWAHRSYNGRKRVSWHGTERRRRRRSRRPCTRRSAARSRAGVPGRR